MNICSLFSKNFDDILQTIINICSQYENEPKTFNYGEKKVIEEMFQIFLYYFGNIIHVFKQFPYITDGVDKLVFYSDIYDNIEKTKTNLTLDILINENNPGNYDMDTIIKYIKDENNLKISYIDIHNYYYLINKKICWINVKLGMFDKAIKNKWTGYQTDSEIEKHKISITELEKDLSFYDNLKLKINNIIKMNFNEIKKECSLIFCTKNIQKFISEKFIVNRKN